MLHTNLKPMYRFFENTYFVRIPKLYPKHIRMGACEGDRNGNRDRVCDGGKRHRGLTLTATITYHDQLNTPPDV